LTDGSNVQLRAMQFCSITHVLVEQVIWHAGHRKSGDASVWGQAQLWQLVESLVSDETVVLYSAGTLTAAG
jgi:hypothetical protein